MAIASQVSDVAPRPLDFCTFSSLIIRYLTGRWFTLMIKVNSFYFVNKSDALYIYEGCPKLA